MKTDLDTDDITLLIAQARRHRSDATEIGRAHV